MTETGTVPVAPELEDNFRIALGSPSASIDALVDEVFSHATHVPVRQTAEVSSIDAFLASELPRQGVPLQTAVAEIMASAGSYYRKNAHPGMFSYVASPGLPTDPLGHALTAALNQNVTGYQSAPGATTVERKLVRWLCRLAGLGDDSDGMLLSGGSLANLSAIAAAVHHALGPDARERGVGAGPRAVILAAETAHFSVQRAAIMLGLGRTGIETIAVDAGYRMDVGALRRKLEELSADSVRKACCVVASAGTTALGIVDPISEIAALCREYGVWLHVDAAYGGAALLSDALRARLEGVGQADSITIDLHKWCYLAFDASALLYKTPGVARDLYAFDADYAHYDRSVEAERYRFFDLSPEVSRRNRALPTYLAWRHYGLDLLGRNVQHNAECAQYLARLVASAPDMELVTEPDLSICCFRYQPEVLRDDRKRIDLLNAKVIDRLNLDGSFMLSPTLIDGRPVLRVCICSYTTRAHHMDELLVETRRIGSELVNAGG